MGFISLEEKCKKVMNDNNFLELPDWFDDWTEYLRDEMYHKYIAKDDNIYEVIEKHDCSNETDIFDVHDNGDGTYDYEVMYYNGGCSFDEAIEEGFDKLSRQS